MHPLPLSLPVPVYFTRPNSLRITDENLLKNIASVRQEFSEILRLHPRYHTSVELVHIDTVLAGMALFGIRDDLLRSIRTVRIPSNAVPA